LVSLVQICLIGEIATFVVNLREFVEYEK
jgi:hypothetical protein